MQYILGSENKAEKFNWRSGNVYVELAWILFPLPACIWFYYLYHNEQAFSPHSVNGVFFDTCTQTPQLKIQTAIHRCS